MIEIIEYLIPLICVWFPIFMLVYDSEGFEEW